MELLYIALTIMSIIVFLVFMMLLSVDKRDKIDRIMDKYAHNYIPNLPKWEKGDLISFYVDPQEKDVVKRFRIFLYHRFNGDLRELEGDPSNLCEKIPQVFNTFYSESHSTLFGKMCEVTGKYVGCDGKKIGYLTRTGLYKEVESFLVIENLSYKKHRETPENIKILENHHYNQTLKELEYAFETTKTKI